MTAFGNFGLHDRIDVGLAVPFVRLSLEGARLNVYRGTSLLQARATASATGFGDVALRGKAKLLDRGASGLAVIGELRLPTGREEDLLGTGETSVRTVLIGSSEVGRLAFHGNLGTRSEDCRVSLDYRGAITISPLSQLTLVGEFLGRRIADLGSLAEERVGHPLDCRESTPSG